MGNVNTQAIRVQVGSMNSGGNARNVPSNVNCVQSNVNRVPNNASSNNVNVSLSQTFTNNVQNQVLDGYVPQIESSVTFPNSNSNFSNDSDNSQNFLFNSNLDRFSTCEFLNSDESKSVIDDLINSTVPMQTVDSILATVSQANIKSSNQYSDSQFNNFQQPVSGSTNTVSNHGTVTTFADTQNSSFPPCVNSNLVSPPNSGIQNTSSIDMLSEIVSSTGIDIELNQIVNGPNTQMVLSPEQQTPAVSQSSAGSQSTAGSLSTTVTIQGNQTGNNNGKYHHNKNHNNQ